MKKVKSICAALMFFCVIGMTGLCFAENYTQLYVFGDSEADVGNFSLAYSAIGFPSPPYPPEIPLSPPYYQGRFSGGPVYSEVVAADFGLGELRPSLIGGTNYAYGMARVVQPNTILSYYLGDVLSSSILPVQSQVAGFTAARGVNGADPDALYIIEGGGNDLGVAMFSLGLGLIDFPTAVSNVQQAAHDLVSSIKVLRNAGAVHIMTNNLPDFGLIIQYAAAPQAASALSQVFNETLEMELNNLGDPKIVMFDMNDFFNMLKNDFAILKISYVGSVMNPVSKEGNPECYFFFDDEGHQSAAAHQLIGAGLSITLLKGEVEKLVTTRALNKVQGNSLLAKLEGAYNNVKDRKIKAAVNKLQSLVNPVRAFVKTRILSAEEARLLLTGAHGIINQFDGSKNHRP